MRGDALTAEKLRIGREKRDAIVAAKRERAHLFASRAELRLTPPTAEMRKRSKGLRGSRKKAHRIKENGEEESKEERIQVCSTSGDSSSRTHFRSSRRLCLTQSFPTNPSCTQRARAFRIAKVQAAQQDAAKRNRAYQAHPSHALLKSKKPLPEDESLALPLCSPVRRFCAHYFPHPNRPSPRTSRLDP